MPTTQGYVHEGKHVALLSPRWRGASWAIAFSLFGSSQIGLLIWTLTRSGWKQQALSDLLIIGDPFISAWDSTIILMSWAFLSPLAIIHLISVAPRVSLRSIPLLAIIVLASGAAVEYFVHLPSCIYLLSGLPVVLLNTLWISKGIDFTSSLIPPLLEAYRSLPAPYHMFTFGIAGVGMLTSLFHLGILELSLLSLISRTTNQGLWLDIMVICITLLSYVWSIRVIARIQDVTLNAHLRLNHLTSRPQEISIATILKAVLTRSLGVMCHGYYWVLRRRVNQRVEVQQPRMSWRVCTFACHALVTRLIFYEQDDNEATDDFLGLCCRPEVDTILSEFSLGGLFSVTRFVVGILAALGIWICRGSPELVGVTVDASLPFSVLICQLPLQMGAYLLVEPILIVFRATFECFLENPELLKHAYPQIHQLLDAQTRENVV